MIGTVLFLFFCHYSMIPLLHQKKESPETIIETSSKMRKINIYVTKVIAILIVFYLTITVVLFISIGDTQPYEIIIYKRGLDSY